MGSQSIMHFDMKYQYSAGLSDSEIYIHLFTKLHLYVASDSKPAYMLMSRFARHIDSCLTTALHEEIKPFEVAKWIQFSNSTALPVHLRAQKTCTITRFGPLLSERDTGLLSRQSREPSTPTKSTSTVLLVDTSTNS